MNLVLIGYRGSGKSTLANELGRRLDYPVWHLDEMIVERAGKPIPQIVAEEGWPSFRDRESELVREASAQSGIVVDCGGGIILRRENVEALAHNGRIVYLDCAVETLAQRIGNDPNRPSLTGQGGPADEVARVLAERRPLYEAAAHFIVDTGQHDLDTCATLIFEWFNDPAYDLGYGSGGVR